MSINRSAGLVYTGTARRYTVPDTIETATISYSMSGGSGGGGGNDSHPGGKGGAAGYIRGSFTVVGGDVLEVGVGGGGTAGGSGSVAAGGRSGQSLTGYVGGQGGHSGPGGGSGAGGGGGGASVIKKNNIAVAVAAGGGAGGGGGNTGAANGHPSPDYPTGAWASYSSTIGQNGADHGGDGGGGGGSGGGVLAGQGGSPVSGDVGGNAGYQGYSDGIGVTQKTELNQINAGWAGGVVFDSADLARLGAAAGAADHYRATNSAYNAFLNQHGVWAGASTPAIPYDSSLLNVPFRWGNALRYFIAPNTSGYYIHTFGRENEFGGATVTIAGYSVVVNGIVVYNSIDNGSIPATEPPASVATKGSFVGYSAEIYYEGPYAWTKVECYNFVDTRNSTAGNLTYDRTWVVNFPVSGNYLFQAAWDNAGRISVDGVSMIERFTGDDAGTFQNVTEETKYIQAGFRNVRMYADNYGGPGSIGCVITGFPIAASSELRNAGVAGGAGTQPGNSGYIDLSMSAKLKRGVKVKVGGTWVTSKEIYVKLNGTWKRSTQVWAKVNGVWKAAYIRTDDSSITFTFSSTSSGWGDGAGNYASGGASSGSSSGGGGGGCKIICQKLAEMGFFDSVINAADQKFGRMLRDQDPDAYNGYLRWAQPVVELLEGKGSATFRKVAFFWVRDEKRRQEIQSNIVAHYLDVIARPWAEEMAYRMKAEGYDKSNPAGRFIMNIGLPMCRSIGRFNKHRESPMWLKTALIWSITTVLLVAVSAISMIDKAFNKIRKIFGRS